MDMRRATLRRDAPVRRLIVPLALAVVTLHAGQAFAQDTFPSPLPSQAEAPASSASQGPHVNGAAPFASLGASAASQAGSRSDACTNGFAPLREEAEKRAKLVKAASDRKAPPDEACKLIGNFGQAELKMIKYVETNSAKCGIRRRSPSGSGPATGTPTRYRSRSAPWRSGARQRGRTGTKCWGRATSGPHRLRASVTSIPCDLDERVATSCNRNAPSLRSRKPSTAAEMFRFPGAFGLKRYDPEAILAVGHAPRCCPNQRVVKRRQES